MPLERLPVLVAAGFDGEVIVIANDGTLWRGIVYSSATVWRMIDHLPQPAGDTLPVREPAAEKLEGEGT